MVFGLVFSVTSSKLPQESEAETEAFCRAKGRAG